MRIEISQLPPREASPNWRGHWGKKYKESTVYHDAVFYTCVDARNRALAGGERFPWVRVRLKVTFVFPEVRTRDLDNVLARFKPGLDAIVDAALVPDDDSEHLTVEPPVILVDKERAPLTVIELEENLI